MARNLRNLMRVFFDTEFTDLTADADLISLGFVSENGPTLYLELSDWDQGKVSDFVRESVLPRLTQAPEMQLSRREAAAAIRGFLVPLGTEIELVSDSIWDWRLLQRLLSDPSGALAPGLQVRHRLHSIRDATEMDIFDQAAAPWQRNAHNALADAHALRAGVLAIEEAAIEEAARRGGGIQSLN